MARGGHRPPVKTVTFHAESWGLGDRRLLASSPQLLHVGSPVIPNEDFMVLTLSRL